MNDRASLHQNHVQGIPVKKMGSKPSARVIAITSGKGGVGKTNVTTNLGIALAAQGSRVCIFDADTNLANINILLGITPEFTLEHFLNGEKSINEILANGPRGIKIIPAASGIASFAALDQDKRDKLINALTELENQYDYLLIDTAAGIGEDVLSFIQSAQHTILIISPEPTSLTDAFALLKTLKRNGYLHPIYVMVNMVMDYSNSMEVYSRFEMAVEKYLHLKVHYAGYISLDESVISAVRLQQPVIIQKPESPASKCFYSLATGLKRRFSSATGNYSFGDFWKEQSAKIAAQSGTTTTAHDRPEKSDLTTHSTDTSRESTKNYINTSTGNVAEATARTTTDISSTEQLTDTVRAFLNKQDDSGESHKGLIRTLVNDYIDKFDSFPLDLRKSLFHAFEIQDFPMSELRDLAITLESLYEKRTQKPLHSHDETLLKLLEDASHSEERLVALHSRVQACYKRRFKAELTGSEESLTNRLKQDSFSEQDFTDLIAHIKDTYQKRFEKAYLDESDHILKDISQIAEQMVGQEAHLHDRLTHLTEILGDTVSAREGLLKKLSPIKPSINLHEQPVNKITITERVVEKATGNVADSVTE